MTYMGVTRWVSLLMMLAGPALADAADCKALANAAPTSLMGAKITKTSDLEAVRAGSGYSVKYAIQGQDLLTLFYFDSEIRTIDRTVLREAFMDTARFQVQSLVKRAGLASAEGVSVDATQRSAPMQYVAILNAKQNTQRAGVDAMALGVASTCIVKLRATFYQPKADALRLIELGLKDLNAHLSETRP